MYKINDLHKMKEIHLFSKITKNHSNSLFLFIEKIYFFRRFQYLDSIDYLLICMK